MSNGIQSNQFERLLKLWAMAGKMILDKNRTPGQIADVLQRHVIDGALINIDRTFSFDPVDLLGAGCIAVEEDERSLKLSEIDLTKIKLETMLKDRESRITGEEKLRRLKDAGYIRLDARILQTFWENKHLIPEAWKQPTNGRTTFVSFDGSIYQDSSCLRLVLYLSWFNGAWRMDHEWLGSVCEIHNVSAVLKM